MFAGDQFTTVPETSAVWHEPWDAMWRRMDEFNSPPTTEAWDWDFYTTE